MRGEKVDKGPKHKFGDQHQLRATNPGVYGLLRSGNKTHTLGLGRNPSCRNEAGRRAAPAADEDGQLRSVNKPGGHSPSSPGLSPRWEAQDGRAAADNPRPAMRYPATLPPGGSAACSPRRPVRPRSTREGPAARRPQPRPGYLAAADPPPLPRLTRGARRPRRRRRLPHGQRRRAEPGPSPPPSAPPPTPLLPPPPSRLSQDMFSAGPRAAPSGPRGGEAARRRGGRGSGTGAERTGDGLGRRGLRMAAVRTLELNKPRGGRTTSGTGPRCSPSCDWSRGLRRRSQ